MEIIILDTSVLLDLFRKRDKEKTVFYKLSEKYQNFAVSVITEFEIIRGATPEQKDFWQKVLKNIKVLPFDSLCAAEAAQIYKYLKKHNKLIGMADILIAATACTHVLHLATLNTREFKRIPQLNLITV